MSAGQGGDAPWGRKFRQVSLAVTSLAAAGTAAAAAFEVWRRAHRGGQQSLLPRGKQRGLTWAEVVRHDRLDDAWVVIDGAVYDVTPFIEEHPGGRLLLLAFAGRDATEPFESVGHSAVARRKLRALHAGQLEAKLGVVKEHRSAMHLGRSASLTGGPSSASLEAECAEEDLWEVSHHGFLPARDPVGVEALNGTAFEPYAEFVELLPALGFTGMLRKKLDADADLQAKLLRCGEPSSIEGLSTDQLERAFSVVGYIMVAYWRGGTLDYSTGLQGAGSTSTRGRGGSCDIDCMVERLPLFLSKPMLLLSETLGRPPMIDYATTVLYNWYRIDKNGPITMSNVRCVMRLTGLIDEEWFFKTHVVIESEASHAVAALIAASRTDDEQELLTQLVALEEALWRVVRACLPIMYERSEDGMPKCSEHIFYQILRPLIKSGFLAFEGDCPPSEADACAAAKPEATQRFLNGPSGAMSSLLPCIDAALGIKMTSEKLRESMKKFKLSMPVRHQEFIDELCSAPNIRQRILLGRPVAGETSHHYEMLVRAFNRVISRVLDFRWQHWQYVKNFVMKPGNISYGVGSGGTTFDFLQQHITDTEKARLTERNEGFTRIGTPGALDWPPMEAQPVANHPTLEFWSVDGKRGLLARDPLTHPAQAAWAVGMPRPLLEAFEAVWGLALRLPALCAADGPYFASCEQAAEKLAALQDDRVVLGMSEVAREYLVVTLCHVAAGCVGCGHRRPPLCIEKPLKAAARSVGRPPRLDFTETVLANWDVTHSGTGGAGGAAAGTPAGGGAKQAEQAAGVGDCEPQVPPQLHPVWRFLGTPDEEWYRSVHLVLHDEAREVVAAIRIGQTAMRDQNDAGVHDSLEKVAAWLLKFCDYFDAHFELRDSRTESVMIRRLEPFISHDSIHDLTWEETACWVYCSGSSVLLPAIHAFFGVQQCHASDCDSTEGERLAQVVRRTLEEARAYMPRRHRDFLEMLEKPGASLRQYCFRRFGVKAVSVEALHNLEVGYNDALNALVRFVSRSNHLVSRFFPQLASTFGAFHSDYERHMRQRRLQLLKMRQRVSRGMET